MKHTIDWRIGCSGFYYKEWKEIFYPAGLPQRLWFQHYCKYFNTLELNASFYRFPTLAGLQKWFSSSPADFIFSVKAPRLITHYKKFIGAEQQITDFYAVVREGLGHKLGAVLFQFPPQVQYTAQLLQTIVNSIDPSFNNVLEFRHSSWWCRDVFETLGRHSTSFSGSSHPKLPDTLIINTPRVYYRFHGVPVLFRSAYEKSFLKRRADEILTAGNVNTAFLYFNNTAGPAALANAQWLQEYISEKK